MVSAAVGSGLYVYNTMAKTVVAYRRAAHDSDVLHTMLMNNGYAAKCVSVCVLIKKIIIIMNLISLSC